MFRNRSVIIAPGPKLDKKQKDSESVKDKFLRPDQVALIAEKTKEVTKFIALAVIGTYAAVKTIDTVSQIAVKKTKSADNEK